jgi:hypothetical protein
MRSKFKFNHCEKIWKKSCMFTTHIKINPKNFRSKFETYIEKQKRETQMWIVYRETQIWIRELFMTDFSFLFLDVCFEFWSEIFRGYHNMCCEHAWLFSDFFAMFKFGFWPHVTRWHAKGACHLICVPIAEPWAPNFNVQDDSSLQQQASDTTQILQQTLVIWYKMGELACNTISLHDSSFEKSN